MMWTHQGETDEHVRQQDWLGLMAQVGVEVRR